MEYVHAFWVGGLICAAVQILMDRTKLMPGRIMVLLVCSGAVLGFLNIYGPFQKFAGAGASVPLLGFGNVLWNGVKEAVEKNGFLGIFMGGFPRAVQFDDLEDKRSYTLGVIKEIFEKDIRRRLKIRDRSI